MFGNRSPTYGASEHDEGPASLDAPVETKTLGFTTSHKDLLDAVNFLMRENAELKATVRQLQAKVEDKADKSQVRDFVTQTQLDGVDVKHTERIGNLKEEVGKKVDYADVSEWMEDKADKEVVKAQLEKKANTDEITMALSRKADVEQVREDLSFKCDKRTYKQGIEELEGRKADRTELITHETRKKDSNWRKFFQEVLEEELNAKADKRVLMILIDSVNDTLRNKAEKRDLQYLVDSGELVDRLETKADKDYISNQLATLAMKTETSVEDAVATLRSEYQEILEALQNTRQDLFRQAERSRYILSEDGSIRDTEELHSPMRHADTPSFVGGHGQPEDLPIQESFDDEEEVPIEVEEIPDPQTPESASEEPAPLDPPSEGFTSLGQLAMDDDFLHRAPLNVDGISQSDGPVDYARLHNAATTGRPGRLKPHNVTLSSRSLSELRQRVLDL